MAERLVTSATCLGCGCTCDDIELALDGARIVEARRACPLGVAWFGDGRVPAAVRVNGADGTLDAAIASAVTMLTRAAHPQIVLGLDISCEAQREAVALADALRAGIDGVTSATAAASILAAQVRGRAGATLGEIRHRADVIVFWGVDPDERYPRFRTRYAPEPAAIYATSRRVIAVDIGDARACADAHARLSVQAGEEVALLTAVAAAVTTAAGSGAATRGPLWDTAGALASQLTAGQYVAIVADGEPGSPPRDPDRADALIRLAQALNARTRAALVTLRGGGNRVGADAMLTAQTGYPMAIDFSRGYPRYLPYEGGLSHIDRRQGDTLVIVGSLTDGRPAIPAVVIGPRATSSLGDGDVGIDTGIAGIHDGGTVLRMDDVPLPLRPALTGPPATADVIRRLREAVGERGREGRSAAGGTR
jgi:formylmethanofuran dehydrogenase subunit B